MKREILIMAEQQGTEIPGSTLGLIAEGKRLNAQLQGSCRLSAVVTGEGLSGVAKRLGEHGVDRVYCFEREGLNRYHPDTHTGLIIKLLEEKKPVFFLLADTALGSDLAPRVAARLKLGLVTRCVDLRADTDGTLEVVKPVSNDFLYQRIAFRNPGLKMVTMSIDALSPEEPDPSKVAEVIRIRPQLDQGKTRTRFIEFVKADPQTVHLADADLIVSGGRGMGQETFGIIHELADALNGSVGGTRPVVDWGVLPYERQIGQTGADVAPRALIACGISGANEFTAGIENARFVVAINTDRTARIFRFADLGLVGDAHEVIPLVVEELKRLKQSPAEGEPEA